MKNLFITETETIKETLKKLDRTAEKVLLVVNDENKLMGTITDGDIRRYILKGKSLDDSIRDVFCRNPLSLKKSDFSTTKARDILLRNKIELLPIIDENSTVIDYITWEQAFSADLTLRSQKEKIDIPVVIMAGGAGTRLEPFTKILPKPLIPVGDKTIIERIIDEFHEYGIREYYITLNYKGEMIKAYFEGIDHDFTLHYIFEKEFLGTAGCLKLLDDNVTDTFILSNCDIIVKADYSDVISFHRTNEAYLTIVSSIQHYKIPYGVITYRENGEVVELLEKPEQTVTINTGVYVMNRDCLSFIPENAFFHMTDLISVLIRNEKKVLNYPVNENDYIDIGQWEEYRKTVSQLTI